MIRRGKTTRYKEAMVPIDAVQICQVIDRILVGKKDN